jgi:hypothetical protein
MMEKVDSRQRNSAFIGEFKSGCKVRAKILQLELEREPQAPFVQVHEFKSHGGCKVCYRDSLCCSLRRWLYPFKLDFDILQPRRRGKFLVREHTPESVALDRDSVLSTSTQVTS